MLHWYFGFVRNSPAFWHISMFPFDGTWRLIFNLSPIQVAAIGTAPLISVQSDVVAAQVSNVSHC